MCTFPFTIATGTHNSSCGNTTCFSGSLDLSNGSSTMRSRARNAGESSSHLKFGCDGCGTESLRMRSYASWWSLSGSPNAFAMDW